ncbi:MAG: winged helix-turn-helix transcriptional regulator, partial [Nioella sp.]
MDAIDRRILSTLQQEGRLPVTDLAERVGLSPTPCARRMSRLEEAGLITGYAARVDPEKLAADAAAHPGSDSRRCGW